MIMKKYLVVLLQFLIATSCLAAKHTDEYTAYKRHLRVCRPYTHISNVCGKSVTTIKGWRGNRCLVVKSIPLAHSKPLISVCRYRKRDLIFLTKPMYMLKPNAYKLYAKRVAAIEKAACTVRP